LSRLDSALSPLCLSLKASGQASLSSAHIAILSITVSKQLQQLRSGLVSKRNHATTSVLQPLTHRISTRAGTYREPRQAQADSGRYSNTTTAALSIGYVAMRPAPDKHKWISCCSKVTTSSSSKSESVDAVELAGDIEPTVLWHSRANTSRLRVAVVDRTVKHAAE